MAGMDLARRAYASMKDEGGEEPEPAGERKKETSDPGAAAGRRLASALGLSGVDGAKVYEAFKDECEGGGMQEPGEE